MTKIDSGVPIQCLLAVTSDDEEIEVWGAVAQKLLIWTLEGELVTSGIDVGHPIKSMNTVDEQVIFFCSSFFLSSFSFNISVVIGLVWARKRGTCLC